MQKIKQERERETLCLWMELVVFFLHDSKTLLSLGPLQDDKDASKTMIETLSITVCFFSRVSCIIKAGLRQYQNRP